MLNKVMLFCKALIEQFIISSKRFPATILLSTGIVGILCIKNHMVAILPYETLDVLDRVALILGLGIPVSLSVKVFFERRPLLSKNIKILLYALATSGLWLYYSYLLPNMELVVSIRYIAVMITFYSMFFFIPYFYKRVNYELYIISLVTKFFITYLYSVILYAGLAAMLATIHVLFALEISYRIYADIGFIVMGIFAPVFFLGAIPKHDDELVLAIYPKVLKVLLLYIIMPLITAYSITLYVYFGKILILRQWPEGIVSNLVMWYSLLSTGVIFAIYPLRADNRWAKVFSKWFPICVLPLLAMMFVALGIRINAYGITENRYFMFLTGLWLVGAMFYFIFSKTPRTIMLTISIGIVSLVAVTGPWSCFSLSNTSQSMRFDRIIAKYDLLENGKISRVSRDISPEDKREIASIVMYFNRYHKLAVLQSLPPNFKIDEMKTVFGFSAIGDSSKYFHYTLKEQEKLVSISGFDYLFQLSSTTATIQKPEIPISVVCTGKNGEVKIMNLGQVIYTKNINDIVAPIHKANGTNDSVPNSEMVFTDENENIKVTYLIKGISGVEESETITVQGMEISLLVKMKMH